MTQPKDLSLVGIENSSSPHLLECSDDGSMVILADDKVMTAWRNRSIIWQRSDLATSCGRFMPGSETFLCGLKTGDVLELEAASGGTLRKVASHPRRVNGLNVSRSGNYLASIDSCGDLVVTELHSGSSLWSVNCHESNDDAQSQFPHGCPQFTTDGSELIVPYAKKEGSLLLVVHRTVSGEAVKKLNGNEDYAKGLEVDDNRIVYAWCVSGHITAWDIDSGIMIHHSSPAHDLAKQRSGLRSHLFGELWPIHSSRQ